MRRDKLDVEIVNVEWLGTDQQPVQPCLIINFEGSEESLKDRFRKPDNSGYTPDDLDLFYRVQSSEHPAGTGGIFSLSDRVTGDLLLEIPASPDLIEQLVHAVREYATSVSEEPRYEVEIRIQGRQVADFTKDALLIYGADGTLLRQRSLIPDEIEI